MEIKLQRLTLTNFKGVQEFEFEPEGLDATISGPNGAGKSTVADALSWLLFGKNQAGDSAFSVKPLDDAGQEIHNLEHEVEAVLEIDGSAVTLNKTMVEKWTKKRGSQNAEFSGHETTYAIDLVPKPKKDFDAYVSGLVREDLFRMLTSITHFNQQKWQDRRRILLEVAGDVTDASVVEAHGDKFAELPGIMESRSFEDTVKMLKAQRKKINDEIEVIPARIDEATKAKPGDAACMPPQGIGSYPDLTAKLQNLQNGRAAVLAGDTSGAQRQIAAKKAEIEDAALKHRKAVMDAEEARRGHQIDADRCARQIDEAIGKRNRISAEVNQINSENAELRKQYKTEAARPAPDTVCSLCGQTLPEDAAANVLAAFNQRRAETLAEINANGKGNVAREESLTLTLAELATTIDKLNAEHNAAAEAAALIQIPDAPNMTSLNTELASLTLKLTSMSTPDTAKIDAEIEQVKDAIRLHDEAALNVKLAGQIEARIAELKEDQKRLGNEIDELDRKLMLCEDFTRAKVSMLEGSVSEKFAPLGFKLFDTQINGGLAECCETLIPSPEGAMVPWSDANTGGKIMAGLMIIKVLGEHYGVSCPVFADNAESLTTIIPDYGYQVIKLVASDQHDGLTVEIEQAEEVGSVA